MHPGYGWTLLAVGVLMGYAAYWIRTLWPSVDGDQLATSQSILASMGVTFVSAAILFWLGIRFRRGVKQDVADAVGDVTAAAASTVQRTVEEAVTKKFDTMREEIYASLQSKMEEQDAAVAEFRDTSSRDSARRSMDRLSEIGALENDKLTVQVGDQPGQLSVFLSLRYVSDEPGFGEPLYTTLTDYSLCFGADIGEKEQFVTWYPSQTYTEVVQELLLELQAAVGLGTGKTQGYDWDAVAARLAMNLQVALDSRRRNPGKLHLAGPLAEVIGINDPWYITADSLENPAYGFLARASDFPRRQIGENGNGWTFQDAFTPPESADDNDWKYALGVATNKFSPVTVGGRRV